MELVQTELMWTELVQTELKVQVEIQQLEEPKVFNSLRLSMVLLLAIHYWDFLKSQTFLQRVVAAEVLTIEVALELVTELIIEVVVEVITRQKED